MALKKEKILSVWCLSMQFFQCNFVEHKILQVVNTLQFIVYLYRWMYDTITFPMILVTWLFSLNTNTSAKGRWMNPNIWWKRKFRGQRRLLCKADCLILCSTRVTHTCYWRQHLATSFFPRWVLLRLQPVSRWRGGVGSSILVTCGSRRQWGSSSQGILVVNGVAARWTMKERGIKGVLQKRSEKWLSKPRVFPFRMDKGLTYSSAIYFWLFTHVSTIEGSIFCR